MWLRSLRYSVAAAGAVIALGSCNERPVYRAGTAGLAGGGDLTVRHDAAVVDGPIFTLPEPPRPTGQEADARECGLEKFQLERVPPSLMLVLDRSSSMSRMPVGGAAGATLWSETLGAMDEVVMATQAQVRWGLKLFPLPGGCTVADGAEAPVAPNNYDMVVGRSRMIGFNQTGGGGTPTSDAMNKAVAYMRTLTDNTPKYIALATDGEPNCVNGVSASGGRAAAVQAVQSAAAAGFKTYVIGIAIGSEGTATLNEMAAAGGVPRTDPMFQFYPVANRADLTRSLNEIAGQITSCVFPLSKPPPAPDSVKVTVDGERVPESGTDGWSYTSPQNMAIQLNGSWCDRLKTRAGQVDIVLGCPGIVVP
jgi:hypothetical protein